MVGDTASDMQFGRNLGMKCAWIRSAPPFEEEVSSQLYDWQGKSLFQLAHEAPSILPNI
jgi:histidinol phosphatase-like enzyme